ncbi:MAG: YihA family ribosome biogenesis GTP-binding protein [Desulfovibrionaceae bacterium]|nr:YihA family ribosome biogenesis GTP-binding protein [Desulfovibrionaceae bacterium]
MPQPQTFAAKLTLEATTFNAQQLDRQLEILASQGCPQVAFAGRSNVGKSSLINALAARRKLAKTSATPGKTRSINFYRAERFALADLPGYGYARCSQQERAAWARLIERYLTTAAGLMAVVLLLDCRLPPQKLDRDLADYVLGHNLPLLPVLTKTDKCPQALQAERASQWSLLLNGLTPLAVSSQTRRGLEALWRELERRCAPEAPACDPAATDQPQGELPCLQN